MKLVCRLQRQSMMPSKPIRLGEFIQQTRCISCLIPQFAQLEYKIQNTNPSSHINSYKYDATDVHILYRAFIKLRNLITFIRLV